MKTPDFWYVKNSFFGAILSPVSRLYTKLGRRHRLNAKPEKLSIPVICIGNIVSGGAGKTPTALAILKLLQEDKISLSPFFLTRGYRGKVEGPERVDDSHDPALWGDEALLLRRAAPTIVSKDRYQGGILAASLGADFIIMDDGMQNYSLRKDVSFCVVDASRGFGNGKVIPQGPLRQPLEDGINLTDAFVLIGEDKNNLQSELEKHKPVFKASLETISDPSLSADTGYIAFCGIGYPEKFLNSLKGAGLKTIDFRAFPDHYDYKPSDIQSLISQARKYGARLITTQKDYARLPQFDGKNLIDILNVEIRFESPQAVVEFVKQKIAA